MAMQGLIATVLALGAAWLARRVRLPGWTGALMVGLALGAVFRSHGSGLSFEPFFIGGQPQMHAIEKYTESHRCERQTLVGTGVTDEAVRELDAQHAAELKPLIETHAAEVRRHHDATRTLTLLIAALLLLIAAGDKPRRLGDALPVALGAGVCISGAAFGAAWLLLADSPQPGIRALLTAGCAAAALPISKRYLTGCNEDDRALLTSVAWWLLTIALAIPAFAQSKIGLAPMLMAAYLVLALLARACDAMVSRGDKPRAAWRLLIGLAFGTAWLMLDQGGMKGLQGPSSLPPGVLLPGAAWLAGQVLIHPNFDPRTLMRLIGPILALLVGMSVNVPVDFHPWLALAALIALCDARALGAWLMIRLLGGRGRDGMRCGAILAIPGPTSLVVAWFLHDLQVIDGPLFSSLVLAGLIGGLLGGAALRLLSTVMERPA